MNSPKKFLRLSVAIPLGCAVFVASPTLHADNLTQTGTIPNSTNWNNGAYWQGGAAPSAGNTYTTAPIAGQAVETQFIMDGITWTNQGNVRDTASGSAMASSTFGGDSLIIATGTRLLGKVNNGSTSTANIVLAGGFISSAADDGGASAILAGTIHQTAATSAIALRPNHSNDTFTFTINSTITGSGVMQLVIYGGLSTNTGLLNLSGDISGFTGTFYLAVSGATAAGSAFTIGSSAPSATLNLVTASADNFHFNLAGNLTFASLVIDGNTLGAGTYDFTALNGYAPGKFLDNGGTITVVPEPGTVALLAFGLMAGLFAWSRPRLRARRG